MTDRQHIPLDSLPGSRCHRACELLRLIRRAPKQDGWVSLDKTARPDESALVDLHKSGVVRVVFTDCVAYRVDTRPNR